MSALGRHLRTLSSLSTRQCLSQLGHRLRGPRQRPRAWWCEGIERISPCDPLAPASPGPGEVGGVALLGQRPYDPSRSGWDAFDRDPLFRYTLHYHEFLAALGPAERKRRVLDWIERHREGVGWEPYPVAMRAIAWLRTLGPVFASASASESSAIRGSLAAQLRHLWDHPEHRLGGNHLLTGTLAAALVAVACEGPIAHALRGTAVARVHALVVDQIAPDGGHGERTPSYHCLLAEQLALLVRAIDDRRERLGAEVLVHLPALRRHLAAMVDFLPAVTHADGDVALWGDSQLGQAACPRSVAGLVDATLADGDADARDSGFARRVSGPWTLLFNAGVVVMPAQVGHLHADALAVELDLGPCRVLVDAGVGTYREGHDRDYARSTAAHNTVTVGGRDQHELWRSHRIGGRAEVSDLRLGPDRLAGTVAGFRVPGTHARTIELAGSTVRIHDRVEASAAATVHYFLPEGVFLEREAGTFVGRTQAGDRFRISSPSGVGFEVDGAPGWRRIGVPSPRVRLSAPVPPGGGITVEFQALGRR